MPHRWLEPAEVSRLAFQSDAVPAELFSPSFYPAIKTVVSLPAPWSLFVTTLGGLNKLRPAGCQRTGHCSLRSYLQSVDRPLFSPFLQSVDRPLFSPFLLTVIAQLAWLRTGAIRNNVHTETGLCLVRCAQESSRLGPLFQSFSVFFCFAD